MNAEAWRGSGAFRLAANDALNDAALAGSALDDAELGPRLRRAFASSRRFFALSAGRKSRFVSDLTYAGYTAPGEERGSAEKAGAGETSAEEEGCEVFTVCQDIAPHDPRVRERWPCHGPVPWPDAEFRRAMLALTEALGAVADRLLRDAALSLGLDDPDVFARLTWSGWHHLRLTRIPPQHTVTAYTVAAHTVTAQSADLATGDGLLVISMQEDCDALTVLPGAIMRFATAGTSPAPPPTSQRPNPDPDPDPDRHAQPATRERYTITYFHVPNFQACVRPPASVSADEYLHYGTHFTTTFMRRYPRLATTRRILADQRLAVLAGLRKQAARVAIAV